MNWPNLIIEIQTPGTFEIKNEQSVDLIARQGQLEIIYDKEKLKYKLKHSTCRVLTKVDWLPSTV